MRISRFRRVALLGLCLILTLGGGSLPASASDPVFSDVDPNSSSPYAVAIYELAKRGIVRGYNDGSGRFGPLDPVLRGQAAAIVVRALGWGDQRGQANFTDQGPVDDELWNCVRALADRGVARGYGDGTYRPLDNVAQVQIISLITRGMIAKGHWSARPDNPARYPDVPADSGAREDIATYAHYTGGIPFATGDGPGGWPTWAATATRREVALVVWSALKTIPGGPATSPAPSYSPVPSSTPAPSVIPAPSANPSPPPHSGAVGRCGESMATWHPPVINGCATGHEHGDAPPAWVHTSKWHPMFDHPGNTPRENEMKHTSFKGFAFREDNVDLYVIAHLDTHPNGHTSRFHSVQIWARDSTGAISHWDYWLDFGEGNNTGPNLRPVDICGTPQSVRPIMAVNYASCPGLNFETWYSRPGAVLWGFDFGFSIKPQYFAGPAPGQQSNGDLAAMPSWIPTGDLNDSRRMELAWYANRSSQRGTFYSTQWGEIVSGPGDARCGQQRTFGARTYTTLCIEQYIAPTLTTIQFPGNAVQKNYDTTGVVLPN